VCRSATAACLDGAVCSLGFEWMVPGALLYNVAHKQDL